MFAHRRAPKSLPCLGVAETGVKAFLFLFFSDKRKEL